MAKKSVFEAGKRERRSEKKSKLLPKFNFFKNALYCFESWGGKIGIICRCFDRRTRCGDENSKSIADTGAKCFGCYNSGDWGSLYGTQSPRFDKICTPASFFPYGSWCAIAT